MRNHEKKTEICAKYAEICEAHIPPDDVNIREENQRLSAPKLIPDDLWQWGERQDVGILRRGAVPGEGDAVALGVAAEGRGHRQAPTASLDFGP